MKNSSGFLLALLGIVVLAVACQPVPLSEPFPIEVIEANGAREKYVSAAKEYELSYPLGWIIRGGLSNGNNNDKDWTPVSVIDYPSRSLAFGAEVILLSKTMEDASLDEIAAAGLALENSEHQITPLSLIEKDIDGERTLLREYTYLHPASPLREASTRRCLADYRATHQKAYILTACADETNFGKFKQVFEEMIESLRLSS